MRSEDGSPSTPVHSPKFPLGSSAAVTDCAVTGNSIVFTSAKN